MATVALNTTEYYLKMEKTKYYILGVVWGHSLIITGLPLFGWSNYQREAFDTSCSINWAGKTVSTATYNLFIIITCYLLHLSIFSFCYYKIIKAFRVVKKPPSQSTDAQTLRLEKVVWYHKIATSRSVTVTSLSMVSVFVIAWTPYTLASVYTMANDSTAPWVVVIPTMFAKSTTLLNPLVCAAMSSKFRDAAKTMIKKKNTIQPTNADIEAIEGRTNSNNERQNIPREHH